MCPWVYQEDVGIGNSLLNYPEDGGGGAWEGFLLLRGSSLFGDFKKL